LSGLVLAAWIEDFDARPAYDERAALTDGVVPAVPPLELVLSAVTLASEHELHRAAEAAPLGEPVNALLGHRAARGPGGDPAGGAPTR
jgi:hypothetical protein